VGLIRGISVAGVGGNKKNHTMVAGGVPMVTTKYPWSTTPLLWGPRKEKKKPGFWWTRLKVKGLAGGGGDKRIKIIKKK